MVGAAVAPLGQQPNLAAQAGLRGIVQVGIERGGNGKAATRHDIGPKLCFQLVEHIIDEVRCARGLVVAAKLQRLGLSGFGLRGADIPGAHHSHQHIGLARQRRRARYKRVVARWRLWQPGQ